MLKAVPKSWFSSSYKVLADGALIAVVTPSWTREAAELTIEGSTYQAYREHLLTGAFLFESGGSILARAEKPSAFFRSFLVRHEGQEYTLEAESSLTRKFVLSQGGRLIGSIYPQSFMTRAAIIDLPEAIPQPVRIFMFWLVMILWKRAADAAAAN